MSTKSLDSEVQPRLRNSASRLSQPDRPPHLGLHRLRPILLSGGFHARVFETVLLQLFAVGILAVARQKQRLLGSVEQEVLRDMPPVPPIFRGSFAAADVSLSDLLPDILSC